MNNTPSTTNSTSMNHVLTADNTPFTQDSTPTPSTQNSTPTPSTSGVQVIKHPLVLHKLSQMRCKDTTPSDFRVLVHEITSLMLYEVTKDLPLTFQEIETPLATQPFPVLANNNIVIAPILRAGIGMLPAVQQLIPFAKTAVIGLYRDEHEDGTIDLVEYYFKAPKSITNADVIMIDPMLATGMSAIRAADLLKERGCKNIRFICIVSAPQGTEAFHNAHPDVPIYTASIDEGLNDHHYIIPGLGDAGDRIFNTVE